MIFAPPASSLQYFIVPRFGASVFPHTAITAIAQLEAKIIYLRSVFWRLSLFEIKLIYASRSHLGTILPTLTSEVRHSPRRTLEDEVLRHSNIAANAPHFTRGESQGVLLKNETYQ